MKKKLEVLFAVLIIFVGIYLLSLMGFFPVFCYPVRYDGPYEGRIVDAETGQPIEGVVVLGVWSREMPTPAGAVHSYYDAMKTVTDKNGEFKIKGLGLLVMSNVIPMDVLIFKAGYEHIGLWPWESFKVDEILKKKVLWEGKKAIIPLKKLTVEERRRGRSLPDPYIGERYDKKENITHSCIPKNIKLLQKEINKDRIERGLEPIDYEGGECEK